MTSKYYDSFLAEFVKIACSGVAARHLLRCLNVLFSADFSLHLYHDYPWNVWLDSMTATCWIPSTLILSLRRLDSNSQAQYSVLEDRECQEWKDAIMLP